VTRPAKQRRSPALAGGRVKQAKRMWGSNTGSKRGRADQVRAPRPRILFVAGSQHATLDGQALLRRAYSGALSSPASQTYDSASVARIQEVSYYHRVTPCVLSNRARRNPVVAGVGLLRRSPTVAGRMVQITQRRTRTAWFRRSGMMLTQKCGSWGMWIRFSSSRSGRR